MIKQLKWLIDKRLIRKHNWSRTFLSGKSQKSVNKFVVIIRCDKTSLLSQRRIQLLLDMMITTWKYYCVCGRASCS